VADLFWAFEFPIHTGHRWMKEFGFLKKPCSIQELQKAIKQALKV
jgi:hypothetical protein